MLPRHNQKFDAFMHAAKTRPEAWRTGLGITVIVGLSVLGGFLLGKYGLRLAEAYQLGLGYSVALEWASQSSKRAVFLSFGVIALALPMLWIAMRFVHQREFRTLFAPNGEVNWRLFWTAFGFVIIYALIFALPELFAGDIRQQLSVTNWVVWALPITLMILLQTTTEELIFRGYLLQQFAIHFKTRWVWWLLPSLLFGLLHYNEIAFDENAWLVVAMAVLFGLILSDITVRTGNLSIAMGLHFANNLTLALLLGIPGQTSAISLFLRDINLQDIPEARAAFLMSFTIMLVTYLVFLLVMRQRR